ncbi:MAG: DMT family transporter [Candidatus Eisenbacteria sp.]|nr:DMT family transporter [Candidatus Eisenbacteria bacterium]
MGEFYALICTIIWAFAVILLQRATEEVHPLALNLFRSSVSVPLLLLTVLITGGSLLRSEASAGDYLILFASGVLGIAVADTLFHKALNLTGAGVNAIVSTAYSPLVVLMAFLLIGERINAYDLIGMVMIISSILITGSLQPLAHRTRAQLLWGVVLGVTEMFFLALSIVIAKPVLDHSPVIWATAVRQSGALIAIWVMVLCSPSRRRILKVYRPSRIWRFMLPGTLLGSYLALIFWIAGMKYTLASVAAIINQTSTAFILILAVIFLGERFTPRKGLAAAIAIAGVLLIALT